MNNSSYASRSRRLTYRAATLSTLTATLVACGAPPSSGDSAEPAGESTSSSAQAQVVAVGATDVTPYLGWGFDSAKQNFLGGCMSSDNTLHVGQPTSHLVFDTALTQEKVESELGGDIDAKAHFGAWKASASANFLRTATTDGYSIAVAYAATYDFGSTVIDPATLHLTQVGTNAQNGGFWADACGDQAVTQIRQGARFFVVIRIDFSSKEMKDQFAAKAAISGTFGEVAGSIHDNGSLFQSHAKIHVEVFQMGGDVSRVSGVFGSPQGGELLPAVACDLGDMQKCMTFLSTAMAYGTDVNGIGTFPTQLKAGPADLSYVTQDWVTLGVQDIPPILSDELKDDRLRLRQYFDTHAGYRRRVERLLDNNFVSGAALSEVLSWKDKLAAQTLQINEVVKTCYDDISQKNLSQTVGDCTVKVDGIASLPHPDPSLLDSYGPEGSVVKRWEALGGAAGPLGVPTTGFTAYGGTAFMQEYQGGAIISQPGIGAFSVRGAIWSEVKAHSDPKNPSYMGFPIEEAHATPDGKGTMQTFTGGAVYSTPMLGTVSIPTGILTYLNAQGGVASSWGYPSANVIAGQAGHIYQNYPRGQFPAAIHYKPGIGAFSTIGAMYTTYKSTPSPAVLLGAPLEEEHFVGNSIEQRFERGMIVGHNGFRAIYGSIYDRWTSTGEGNGYGWPTEDMTPAGCQSFDYGTFCAPVPFSKVSYAPVVVGAVRAKWMAMGRETGRTLGHPITDELGTPDGQARYSEFEAGAIVYRGAVGSLYSPGNVYSKWQQVGAGSSCLGYPTQDYASHVQYYEHGTIVEVKSTDPRDHRDVAVVHCK